MTRSRNKNASAHAAFAVSMAILLSAVSGPAAAHATLETSEAASGSFHKAVVKVPHGCQGSPTTSVTVTIPQGVVSVKPMPKPGWTLTTRKAAYATPVDGYRGNPVAEGVVEIVWSGGRLLDEHYDEFVFQGYVSGSVPAGSALPVAVKQTCETGEISWSEVRAPGAAEAKLAFPAPLLKITAGKAKAAAAVVETQTGLKIGPAWTRATPAGAPNAAAFMRIENTGKLADMLIAAELAGGKRTELHEMESVEGVMRMRRVDTIPIPPGTAVELKPGGLHVMLLDLERPITQGEIVKGTLVFEKAGRVVVEFSAAAIGAASPDGNDKGGGTPSQGHGHH